MFQLINVVQISHHGDFFKTNCLDLERLHILQSSKGANFILFRSKFDFSILIKMHPKFRIYGFFSKFVMLHKVVINNKMI
jgi:hypothetical protein